MENRDEEVKSFVKSQLFKGKNCFGTVKAEEIADMIKIAKIQNIGFHIVSISCDQGSNNRKVYRIMGADESHPYYLMGDSKIFLLYDYLYLLKSVRNCI